jgi:2-polyprenyl-6-hydroxyphenyl methylase/3-demethylubiquinone-9 3-methyltransferase
MAAVDFSAQVAAGARFEFGENWASFFRSLDDQRIAEAEASLRAMLGRERLTGLAFVDVGSGSGLFSLAATRLGASRVYSFDYDPSSVACTEELRRRWGQDGADWTIERGSALDSGYLESLGTFDVVYSWGVLHHTGDMWTAIDNVSRLVARSGLLFISIYNDQGRRSRLWRRVKRRYNELPRAVRAPYVVLVMAPREALSAAWLTLHGRPQDYVRVWTGYKSRRGMSRWHDLVDWVGGYPFEVAAPEEVFERLHARGFALERLTTCGGRSGCNQFVFARVD